MVWCPRELDAHSTPVYGSPVRRYKLSLSVTPKVVVVASVTHKISCGWAGIGRP